MAGEDTAPGEPGKKAKSLGVVALIAAGLAVCVFFLLQLGSDLRPEPSRPSEQQQVSTAPPVQSVTTAGGAVTAVGVPTIEPMATMSSLATVTPMGAQEQAPSRPSRQENRHLVRGGENVGTIAEQYGAEVRCVLHANHLREDDHIFPGQELQVPVLGGWYHVPERDEEKGLSNTLGEIALYCQVSFDELVAANMDVVDTDNLDRLSGGAWLFLGANQPVAACYDCSPLSARAEVLEYVVQCGEQLACLAQKFGILGSTILQANQDRLPEGIVDGVELIVPPHDGAVYAVSVADVANGMESEDIARWYSVEPANVLDWNGYPVQTLTAGLQLFVSGGYSLDGPFDSNEAAGVALAPQPTPGESVPDMGTPALATSTPRAAMPGALLPNTSPWTGRMSDFDTGFCPLVDGAGWTGSLSWPVDGRELQEGRGFRPGHSAIDILAPIGASVYAAESGVVIWGGFSTWGYGNLVVLAHGETWQTYYAHLTETRVSCGQSVARGDLIGTIGQTGMSNFPHIHFVVRYGGLSYDPLAWLP